MLGFNIFGAASGVVGLLAIAISLYTWLSPWRRLRALDATMDKASGMLAAMQEEYAILDRLIVRRAHKQLYRARKAARFRLRLQDVDSVLSTALATFSSLPLEIGKVRRQVQGVLDQLQLKHEQYELFKLSAIPMLASTSSTSSGGRPRRERLRL